MKEFNFVWNARQLIAKKFQIRQRRYFWRRMVSSENFTRHNIRQVLFCAIKQSSISTFIVFITRATTRKYVLWQWTGEILRPSNVTRQYYNKRLIFLNEKWLPVKSKL